MEQEIKADFGAINQKIADILQVEQNRLLALGQTLATCGLGASYRQTEEFAKLFKLLESVKIGELVVVPLDANSQIAKAEPKNVAPSAATSSEGPPSQVVFSDKTRTSDNRNRKRANISRSRYDDMELVVKLERNDLGFCSPRSIIAMPDPANCFAVMHPSRLAFVSPVGKVLSSHLITGTRRAPLQGNFCPTIIARSPVQNQLICVSYGEIKSLSLPDWPCTTETILAKVRISGDYEEPLGLAISASANRLFTGFGHEIKSFSLIDWQGRGEWYMGKLSQPFVLGVSGGKLFFREKSSTKKVYTVTIDEADGKLDLETETIFADCFDRVAGVTFDNCDNVLTIDERSCSLRIFDKDGDRFADVPCFKGGRTCGRTVSLATMAVPTGGELFSFEDGQICCSNIVAVADFDNENVLFFGSPVRS